MIKITFLEKEEKIVRINAKGHALFDEYGKDIVCSAVSAILVGGCNALENNKEYKIIVESGNLLIDTLGKITANDQIVMRTILTQLMTIEDSYNSYISISKEL